MKEVTKQDFYNIVWAQNAIGEILDEHTYIWKERHTGKELGRVIDSTPEEKPYPTISKYYLPVNTEAKS